MDGVSSCSGLGSQMDQCGDEAFGFLQSDTPARDPTIVWKMHTTLLLARPLRVHLHAKMLLVVHASLGDHFQSLGTFSANSEACRK